MYDTRVLRDKQNLQEPRVAYIENRRIQQCFGYIRTACEPSGDAVDPFQILQLSTNKAGG